jgi:FkbM family methyltransferase
MNILQRFSEIIAGTKNCVIFEIGACDGAHTNAMCNIIKESGIVDFSFHAFEPSPDLTNRFLSRNLQHFPNLKFVPAAVGGIDGTVDFYLSSGEETRKEHFKQSFYGSSSIKQPHNVLVDLPDIKFKKIQSECYRLDTYCTEQKIDKVDFIWADVQGAESDMIEGGKNILKKTR